MFNYQKEIIINDVANKVIADTTNKIVIVKRGANYDLHNIKGCTIHKTKGRAGNVASVVIAVPTAHTAGYPYFRLTMFLSTPSKEFVEFAYPNYQEFGKPFIVETAAVTGEGFAKAIKLALNEDNELFTVAVSGQNVTITTKESWIDLKEVALDEIKPVNNGGLDYEEAVTATGAVGTITHAVQEFGTAKWLVENLRFPSYPNLRYNHLYADESPVAGTTYTEYMFEYKIENATNGGTLALGQQIDSVTNHILYIPEGSETAFQGVLDSALGGTITWAAEGTSTERFNGTYTI